MRHLALREYQTTPAVPLSQPELGILVAAVPSIGIRPNVGQPGCYDLTPGSTVGVVQIDGLAIEIRPKLPIERVLFLISYAIDPQRWLVHDFDFKPQDTLVEALIPGFIAQVRRAFRRGVMQGYRTQEDALLTVRGRIRFEDQIRKRFGILPPIDVRYDEFTEDITENRLIKAAIAQLGRMRIRSAQSRTLLRAFDSLLATVELVPFDPRQLPTVHYTRLNEHYRAAVELSRLILRGSSFELGMGTVRATSLLVDMNQVFEDFVVVALREELKLSEKSFPQGQAIPLDQRGQVWLEPDIAWWEGSRCRFVGDVKYKKTESGEIKHPDLYQLLAYTTGANLHRGLLIYAAGEAEPVQHQVVHIGKTLETMTLDLKGTPEEILGSIGVVAARIRAMHRDSLVMSNTYALSAS